MGLRSDIPSFDHAVVPDLTLKPEIPIHCIRRTQRWIESADCSGEGLVRLIDNRLVVSARRKCKIRNGQRVRDDIRQSVEPRQICLTCLSRYECGSSYCLTRICSQILSVKLSAFIVYNQTVGAAHNTL